jgi:protein-tyrosine phosphatase
MVAEPFHAADDELANLRDVGGLRLDGGGATRRGVLLRSGAPLPGDRPQASTVWPARTVLDLRGLDELRGQPHPLAVAGTTVHSCPFLDAPATGPGAVDWSATADLATAYLGFLRHGAAKLAGITELVADCAGPILVHCTAGKDRTGVVVAVLLRAAGVSRAEVIKDYRATEAALPAILARIPPELVAALDPTVAQRMMGVPEQAITAVLDEVDAAPEGAAGWLRAAGANARALDSWRRRLTTTLTTCD